ncbi:MAG: hypothetical protein ACOYD3_11995, partial [Kiritimatiellia bacterium]
NDTAGDGGLQRSGLSVHPTAAVPSAAAASFRIGSRYSILSSSYSSSSSLEPRYCRDCRNCRNCRWLAPHTTYHPGE